jgi:hypothetical protein
MYWSLLKISKTGHVDGRRLAQLISAPGERRLLRAERVQPSPSRWSPSWSTVDETAYLHARPAPPTDNAVFSEVVELISSAWYP